MPIQSTYMIRLGSSRREKLIRLHKFLITNSFFLLIKMDMFMFSHIHFHLLCLMKLLFDLKWQNSHAFFCYKQKFPYSKNNNNNESESFAINLLNENFLKTLPSSQIFC